MKIIFRNTKKTNCSKSKINFNRNFSCYLFINNHTIPNPSKTEINIKKKAVS